MVWTRFMDMHSGGGTKEPPFQYIYIEAPEDEAKTVFYNRFGHNPERVTCTCCGDDYAISSEDNLAQITGYDRNCHHALFRPDGTECDEEEAWVRGKGLTEGYTQAYVERDSEDKYSLSRDYLSLSAYLAQDDVLAIAASEIPDEQRSGEVPEQGYVWVGQ